MATIAQISQVKMKLLKKPQEFVGQLFDKNLRFAQVQTNRKTTAHRHKRQRERHKRTQVQKPSN